MTMPEVVQCTTLLAWNHHGGERMAKYFYRIGDIHYGPVEGKVIEQMFLENRLDPKYTELRREGTDRWFKAKSSLKQSNENGKVEAATEIAKSEMAYGELGGSDDPYLAGDIVAWGFIVVALLGSVSAMFVGSQLGEMIGWSVFGASVVALWMGFVLLYLVNIAKNTRNN